VIDAGSDAPFLPAKWSVSCSLTSHEISSLTSTALIAYGFSSMAFMTKSALDSISKGDRFLTCSITELGFVRVLGNVRAYGMDVAKARSCDGAKAWRALPLEFIPDGNDISFLPKWTKSPAQTRTGICFNWRVRMERFSPRWMWGFLRHF